MDAEARFAAGRIGVADVDDALGLLERQAAQQDAVDDAEHRGRKTDSQGQGEHRRGGMPGISGQHAETEAEVARSIPREAHRTFSSGSVEEEDPLRWAIRRGGEGCYKALTPWPPLPPPHAPSLGEGERTITVPLRKSAEPSAGVPPLRGGRAGWRERGMGVRATPRAASSSRGRQVVSSSSKIGQVGLAAAGGVDVPAPEERPLEVGAVGLEHAEDEAVHAVQDAELEDVGAEEAPDRSGRRSR